MRNVGLFGLSRSGVICPGIQQWRTVKSQPGYFGLEKRKIIAGYNREYGLGNWRIAWEVNREVQEFDKAMELYEEGYYQHLIKHPDIVEYLVKNASDVYDYDPKNVNSGHDYTVQGSATHIQDISIRRIINLRLNRRFEGSKLIQIRGRSEDEVGRNLQPGNIPFHRRDLITKPELTGWWQPGSIESFYQSNKILQVKNGI